MTQSQAAMPDWLAWFIPVFFIFFWILITALLGAFSGWFKLQARFPSDDETPLLRLRSRSGSMYGINFNGILTFEACASGMRVRLWRLFGPFQRSFQVPWNQIEAEPVTRFFEPKIRLHLGRPEAGRLTIDLRTWERLKAASQGATASLSLSTMKRLERGLFRQWLAVTVLVGGFFSLAFCSEGQHDAGSLAMSFAFPAIGFGVVQCIRHLVELR